MSDGLLYGKVGYVPAVIPRYQMQAVQQWLEDSFSLSKE